MTSNSTKAKMSLRNTPDNLPALSQQVLQNEMLELHAAAKENDEQRAKPSFGESAAIAFFVIFFGAAGLSILLNTPKENIDHDNSNHRPSATIIDDKSKVTLNL